MQARFGSVSWALVALAAIFGTSLPGSASPAFAAGQPVAGKPVGSAAVSSVAPALDVKTWELANGLRVLFLADHKAPIAAVQVFYHVGSKDERVGIRGVAHMFEHMMFKGSEHVPPEEHARLLKEVGGDVNAFTTEDITAYHETVPPSYVGFAMKLEAERMRALRLSSATVDSERKVVEEEKRLRIDNDPFGKAFERFTALAFRKHNYNWTAAGTLEDLEKVTPADCQKFYDRFYLPNNATLVVVGDVAEAEVRRAAEEAFGAIPRGPAPPRVEIQEPPQDKLRDEAMELEVRIPVLIGGYHIPRASDPDIAPLEVLATILSGGESSRLHQRLVRQEKLALAAGGLAQPREHPSLFIVFAAYLPGKDAAKLRQLLFEEIARVRKAPVLPDELEKAKNQLAARHIFSLQSVDGIATQLGEAEYIQGDWRQFLRGADKYLGVTAADVKRVAEKYLVDANLTVLTLRPLGSSAATKAGAAGGGKR